MRSNFLSRRLSILGAVAAIALLVSGCASYVTPGGPAPLNARPSGAGADAVTREAFGRKPEARFPSHVIATRVQAPGYATRSASGYGTGKYSVVTVRDVESDKDYQRMVAWPGVAQLGMLNRMLLPAEIGSLDDLRESASKLQADILLLYTIDTRFIDRNSSALLTTISLGFGPTTEVQIDSTASALFLDVRTGFIYGAAEATSSKNARSSVWRTASAADEARQSAEKAAFQKLVDSMEGTWGGIVTRYYVASAKQ